MRFGQSAMAYASWTSRKWEGLHQVCFFVFALGAASGAVVRAQGMTTYREPKIHEVGGPGVAWTIPRTPAFFQDWASNVSFRAGDVLQFNKPEPGDIAVISENNPDYDGCNTAEYGYTHLWNNVGKSALFGKLNSRIGIYHVMHVSPSNCAEGLQFALTEEGFTIPSPPEQSPTALPLRGRAAQVFEVGGTGMAWSVPDDKDFYINWAANMSFRMGDELRFNFLDPDFKVSEVPDYESYESCTAGDEVRSLWTATSSSSSSRTYTFERIGVHYFVASGPVQYCVQGMKLAAFVSSCEDDGALGARRKLGEGAKKTISLVTGLIIAVAVLLCCIGFCRGYCRSSDTVVISSGPTQKVEIVQVMTDTRIATAPATPTTT